MHSVLVVPSQVETPDCLVRGRSTGQVARGRGRAVLTAMLGKGRKKIEKTKMDRCEDGDQF